MYFRAYTKAAYLFTISEPNVDWSHAGDQDPIDRDEDDTIDHEE